MLSRPRPEVARTPHVRLGPWRRTVLGLGALALLIAAAGCGTQVSSSVQGGPPALQAPPTDAATTTVTVPPSTTSTTAPCALAQTPGTANTVPVGEVCSAAGAPHSDSPRRAMTYLAHAWDTDNVQELDYVTDPAGRAEMDSMATLMVNLHFEHCTENPAGDYTCYLLHDIAQSTSSTAYPDPGGYPPGEAVFTVAPAEASGWYLTEVIHCG